MLWQRAQRFFCVSNCPAKNAYLNAGGFVLALAVMALGPRMAFAVVHASYVVDARTGQVLHSENANRLAHPASLAKLMTLYITFQELERGKLTLHKELHVSRHAAGQEPMKLWLRPGSEITVRSAILAITTLSANDAAVVLAEGIAGSEPRFARRMTRTARELGMSRTTFYNASGLPNRHQWTTAHDMAKLAIALIDGFPAYYHFFSVRSFRFHGHLVYGHDHLLDHYPGTDGMKTGYIRASGYNLVTSVERDHRRLVGVVLGGRTAGARDHLMMALLTRGFASSPRVTEAASREPQPSVESHRSAKAHLVSATAHEDVPEDAGAQDCVIEIGGGFSSEHSVRRVLKSAILSAPHVLSPSRELVVKLRGRHYRARFSHLSASTAMRACHVLEERRYTCKIIRMPAPQEDVAGVTVADNSQAD